jgi:hypothetical protein
LFSLKSIFDFPIDRELRLSGLLPGNYCRKHDLVARAVENSQPVEIWLVGIFLSVAGRHLKLPSEGERRFHLLTSCSNDFERPVGRNFYIADYLRQ